MLGRLVWPHARRSTFRLAELVLYAAPTQFQYDDFADDRARGVGHNPFGNYRSPYVTLPSDELYAGPFPGDEAFIEYNLFHDSALKSSAGTAVFVCQYGLKKSSFCDATFQLSGGNLVGFDSSTFSATTYALALTSRTAGYRGMKGEVVATLSPASSANAFPLFAVAHGIVGQAQRLAFTIQPQAGGAVARALTQFAYPTKEQCLDHNDDEARGDTNNPLGPRQYPQCKKLVYAQEADCVAAITKAASITIDEHNNGPFPGDQAVFAFKLYTDSSRRTASGSAVLTCQYYFDRNGYCDVAYQLKGGTLYGAGTLNFDSKQFAFAITEGSGVSVASPETFRDPRPQAT